MTALVMRAIGKAQAVVWLLAAVVVGVAGGLVATGGIRQAALLSAVALAAVAAAIVVRRVEYGLAFVLLTLPLDKFGRLIEQPVSVTVFHFALLLLLGVWFLRLVQGTAPRPRFSAIDGALVLILVAVLWSLPHSADAQRTVFAAVRMVGLIAFVLVFESEVSTRAILERLLKLLVWLAVPMALIAIAQSFLGVGFGSFLGYGEITRGGAFFDDPNFLGGYLSAALCVAAAYIVHARELRRAAFWALPVLPLVAGLYATYSRSAWVGSIAGLVIVAVTAPRDRRFKLIAAGALLAIAVVAYAPGIVTDRFASALDINADRSVATRYYMNQSMFDMIDDNPVWGTGLDAFKAVYPAYRYPGARDDIIEPHQLPIAMVAEMGVAGLLAELVLVVALAATWFKRPRRDGFFTYEAAVLAGLVCLLSQTLFQYYLYFEYLWLFFALSVVANRIAEASRLEVS